MSLDADHDLAAPPRHNYRAERSARQAEVAAAVERGRIAALELAPVLRAAAAARAAEHAPSPRRADDRTYFKGPPLRVQVLRAGGGE